MEVAFTMQQFPKVKGYELLNEKVYRALKEKIIKGTIKPGTKISEGEIAKQMGVSRTPIREAMRKLEVDGLVIMNPNKGGQVIDFSIEDLQEVLQIRKLLEGFAAYIAAKKISDKEIIKLGEIIEKMRNAATKSDIATYTNLNSQFHNVILKLSGNKRLIRLCSSLSGHEYKFQIEALTLLERLKYSIEEHIKILEALKKGNSIEAKSLSQLHIENVLKNILLYKKGKKDEDKA